MGIEVAMVAIMLTLIRVVARCKSFSAFLLLRNSRIVVQNRPNPNFVTRTVGAKIFGVSDRYCYIEMSLGQPVEIVLKHFVETIKGFLEFLFQSLTLDSISIN